MPLYATPTPELRDLVSRHVRVQIENKEQAEEAVRFCQTYGLVGRGESTTVDSILDGNSQWPKYGSCLHLQDKIGFCRDYEMPSMPIISYEEFIAAAVGQELPPAFQFSGDFGDLFAGVS